MTDFRKISDTIFEMTIDNLVFSQEVVFKSINWFIDKYNFYFNQLENNKLKITIELKANSTELDFNVFKEKLNFYLNDYKTREIIYNQTKNIRDIIMVKAFSSIEGFNEEMINFSQK